MITDTNDKEQAPLILVAVYGTLKREQCNHHVMLGAQYVGADCLNVITLYDLGPYPGAKVEASEGIDIEVFAVTPAHLAALDVLEEYNSNAPEQGMYDRVLIQTRYGHSWIYIYNAAVNELVVQRRGGWLPAPAQVLQDQVVTHTDSREKGSQEKGLQEMGLQETGLQQTGSQQRDLKQRDLQQREVQVKVVQVSLQMSESDVKKSKDVNND